MTNLDWLDHAACQRYNPEWWFSDDYKKTRTAIAICNVCPVKDPCLQSSLTYPYGVWGGLTAHERRQLHRKETSA